MSLILVELFISMDCMKSDVLYGKTWFFVGFSKYLCNLPRVTWYTIMEKMENRCQANQTSMYFIYDVMGSSFVIAFSKVTITSKAVPEPMNLSLE